MKYENLSYNEYLVQTSEGIEEKLKSRSEQCEDYETTCAPQFTQENDVIWGDMPIYEGYVKHYAEI